GTDRRRGNYQRGWGGGGKAFLTYPFIPGRGPTNPREARPGGKLRGRTGMTRGYALGKFRDKASSTAMRTATPISTCSRISDWAPSATMESISTTRFIGHGCITSASAFAYALFSS